jgi:hypothetical protein
MNHTAPLTAKFASIVSPRLAAYIDNATLTKLFPINIAINVLSPFCLRFKSKDQFACAGNSDAYLFILYIGTPITANSDEENSADNSNKPMTINKGIMCKKELKSYSMTICS